MAEGLYGEANKRLQKAIADKNIGQRSLLFKAWCRWQLTRWSQLERIWVRLFKARLVRQGGKMSSSLFS